MIELKPTEENLRSLKMSDEVMILDSWYYVWEIQKIRKADTDGYKSAEPCPGGMIEVAA